tara:strand:+ start:337 stop:1368 length:1032 start_codon:yes stop_codon:yes gene_type:complete
MKIFFFDSGDPKLGSNRIYIKNLSNWIKPYTKKIRISKKFEAGYDFYICSKYCSSSDLEKIKSNASKSIIGQIHPDDSSDDEKKKLKLADFYIVGSIEEKAYLQNYCKNIFRFPQIENYNLSFKKHFKLKKIILGYHGNLNNLKGSNQNFVRAIELLSKKYNLEFHIIYNKKLGNFSNAKINYKIIDWSQKNLKNFLKKVDIGIVPATNNLFFDKDPKDNFFLSLFKYFFSKFGNKSDYIIQFKYKSNPGRSHLFHQAGIPVVAGFWPSHFEILSDMKNGFLAHSTSSWVQSIEKLIISHHLRGQMSKNAFKAYRKIYNPKIWTDDLINFLKIQKNEKNKHIN